MRASLGLVRGGIGILGEHVGMGDCTGDGCLDETGDSFGNTDPNAALLVGSAYGTVGAPIVNGGSSPSLPSSGTSPWDALASIFKPVANIFAVSSLPPGSVLIQGPNGTQMIRYANGQQVPYSPSGGINMGTGSTSGLSSLLMLGIVGVVVAGMMRK